MEANKVEQPGILCQVTIPLELSYKMDVYLLNLRIAQGIRKTKPEVICEAAASYLDNVDKNSLFPVTYEGGRVFESRNEKNSR